MGNQNPKIGLALSGGSNQGIANIGVLEVLTENHIPIDYLVGCSSGSLISASFVTGTMEELKGELMSLNFQKVLSYWSMQDAQGALFHLKKAEEMFRRFTKGLRFEDVRHPKLGFTASDLNSGELVVLSMGDMVSAIKASMAIPGLFEPVVWGNKLLVDGGLFNIVPTTSAKEMGADIVIGVNIAGNPFILSKAFPIWRFYKFLSKRLGIDFFKQRMLPKIKQTTWTAIMPEFENQGSAPMPGIFHIVARSMESSEKYLKQWQESGIVCDLMIEPAVQHFSRADFNNVQRFYLEGRRAAEAAVPQIKRLIESYESRTMLKRKFKAKDHPATGSV